MLSSSDSMSDSTDTETPLAGDSLKVSIEGMDRLSRGEFMNEVA